MNIWRHINHVQYVQISIINNIVYGLKFCHPTQIRLICNTLKLDLRSHEALFEGRPTCFLREVWRTVSPSSSFPCRPLVHQHSNRAWMLACSVVSDWGRKPSRSRDQSQKRVISQEMKSLKMKCSLGMVVVAITPIPRWVTLPPITLSNDFNIFSNMLASSLRVS